MDEKSYYLVYVLEERQDYTADCHTLYKQLKDAQMAMTQEIEECAGHFTGGSVLIDLERCYEFRNEDGYGYTVGIEELKPL